MIRKIITTICLTIVTLFIGISVLTPSQAYADDVCSSKASAEVKKAAGCPGYKEGDKLKPIIVNILNAVIGISGLVAVVFVIIGGVGYMTSTGDPGKTEKAKKTILYAVIGMAVCVLSFAIVNFAIRAIDGTATGPEAHTDKTSCTNAGYKWSSGKCIEKTEEKKTEKKKP